MKSESYKWFIAALAHEATHKWPRRLKALAMESHISPTMLTAILKEKSNASFDTQVNLASSCGYSYPDFLVFGRKLLEGENPEPQPEPAKLDTEMLEKLSQKVRGVQRVITTLRENSQSAIKQKEDRKKGTRQPREIISLTLDHHQYIGNELKLCREALRRAADLIYASATKNSEEYRSAVRTEKIIDHLRSTMEDRMYENFPDTELLQVYWGDSKELAKIREEERLEACSKESWWRPRSTTKTE